MLRHDRSPTSSTVFTRFPRLAAMCHRGDVPAWKAAGTSASNPHMSNIMAVMQLAGTNSTDLSFFRHQGNKRVLAASL